MALVGFLLTGGEGRDTDYIGCLDDGVEVEYECVNTRINPNQSLGRKTPSNRLFCPFHAIVAFLYVPWRYLGSALQASFFLLSPCVAFGN